MHQFAHSFAPPQNLIHETSGIIHVLHITDFHTKFRTVSGTKEKSCKLIPETMLAPRDNVFLYVLISCFYKEERRGTGEEWRKKKLGRGNTHETRSETANGR